MKLFKLLTGEKRFMAVDENFEIIRQKPTKIKIDEVTRYNPNVPKELSEVIYHMTHHDKKQRAKVFSELFVLLKNLSKKKS